MMLLLLEQLLLLKRLGLILEFGNSLLMETTRSSLGIGALWTNFYTLRTSGWMEIGRGCGVCKFLRKLKLSFGKLVEIWSRLDPCCKWKVLNVLIGVFCVKMPLRIVGMLSFHALQLELTGCRCRCGISLRAAAESSGEFPRFIFQSMCYFGWREEIFILNGALEHLEK